MIPVKDTLVDIDNLPGEEIAFGIGDPRFVMKTQADLYSDIITAIIREYSTNAYDAHVMADNPDPIEVTLPSLMNPFFVVEDKGVGMNVDLFRKVYTQFGVSDKRDSNKTNGMLGYGSKSGIAYTTQFTVTSVRDGVKTTGVVKRKPDWAIVLKVVSTVTTDEPNGTRIIIPVPASQHDEFNHKAREFYKWWLPGRVKVNGEEPQHNVGEEIVEGLYYSKEWNQSHIVMGNVAYRIANPDVLFYNKKMNRINFVAYVDEVEGVDGSVQAAVEFTPSREDLKYTDHTKATLHKVVDNFEKQILAKAEAEIAAATTHAEAYIAWNKWTDALGKNLFADLEFNGDKFVSDFKVRGTRYAPNGGYGRSAYGINSYHVEAMPKTMFITDYALTLSSRHKQMAVQYAKQMGWSISYFVFTASKADEIVSPWISKDQFVDYETMKAAVPKVRKQPSTRNYYNPNAGRVKGSWDYYTAGGKATEKPIPTGDMDIFYISLQTAKAYNVSGILRNMGDTTSVVIEVPGNRHDKFLRENPKVKEFIPHAKAAVVKDTATLLSDDAKEVMNIHWETREWVRRLDKTKVTDPEIARIHNLIENEKSLTKAYEANKSLAQQVKMWYDLKHYEPKGDSKSLYVKYPLLDNMPTYGKIHEHVYLYLNAVHAAESEKKND